MTVLLMDEYRKAKPRKAATLPNCPHWYCLACNTDQFKLYQNGDVHCANCGSRIRNVNVRGHEDA